VSTYYPYFRGKQFELIAIREFAETLPGGGAVHPIIEPVRDPSSNTGLSRTVVALEKHGVDYTVVINPTKGDLADEPDAAATILASLLQSSTSLGHLTLGVSLRAGGDSEVALDSVERSALAGTSLNVIYDQPVAGPADVGRIANHTVSNHILEAKRDMRSLRAFPDGEQFVLLDRSFKRLPRNTAYIGKAPSVFSNAHPYLEEDGFAGLSDYLTVGDDYSEGGALPLALVIHITYQEPNDPLIYIRHFCSSSNQDQSDPGGKFLEAVQKLVTFADSRALDNPALDAFRTFHRESRFPGLGVVKKLSMQNHLYVMNEALG
jgi:hypothetical protein